MNIVSFDLKKILALVEKGTEVAEGLLPFARAIPGVAIVETAVKVASAVSETLVNVQARAVEAGVVISSKDQEEIQAITARLAAVNDGLMKAIQES